MQSTPTAKAETDNPAQRVAERFALRRPTTQHAMAALAEAFARVRNGPARIPFLHWGDTMARTAGVDCHAPPRAVDALPHQLGLAKHGVSGIESLFLLQTYFALLVRKIEVHATVARPTTSERTSCADGSRPAQNRARSVSSHELCPPAEAGDSYPAEGGVLDWYLEASTPALKEALEEVERRLRQPELFGEASAPPSPERSAPFRAIDWFKPLHHRLFPKTLRHLLGEYYTPDWLADHILDLVGFNGRNRWHLLDPACGSGTFLLRALQRMIDASGTPAPTTQSDRKLLVQLAAQLRGFDLNPLAAMTATANLRIALHRLSPNAQRLHPAIEQRDTILDAPASDVNADTGHSFDCIVGNPPWIAWDHLPEAYRRATLPLWQHYGLFSLSGQEARHGGAKKDLAMLMLYAVADRYLREGGRLGMVITQTVFQTKGAGDGFRRFRLGQAGAPLGVLRADDFVSVRPFESASNWAGTITLVKGRQTVYPVSYVKWDRMPRERSETAAAQTSTSAGTTPSASDGLGHARHMLARPADPGRIGSPWLILPAELDEPLRAAVGSSDYSAHLGANSGGANGVYWVDLLGRDQHGIRIANAVQRGKRAPRPIQCLIEPDLLYPLIRWSDVAPFLASPSCHIILAQDARTRRGIELQAMTECFPLTYAYLERFRGLLRRRAAYRRYQQNGPFYSMYNVGPYTLAPYKVVWRRMDRQIRAAVVSPINDPELGQRVVVPQETCVLIPTDTEDEAHYLAALLNSSPARCLVQAFSVRGGKGFGSPSMLDYLALKRFSPTEGTHRRLADLGRRARAMAAQPAKAPAGPSALEESGILKDIDVAAGATWGFGRRELVAISEHLCRDNPPGKKR